MLLDHTQESIGISHHHYGRVYSSYNKVVVPNDDKWDTGDRRYYTSVGWRSMVNICQWNLVADCQKLALNEQECGLYLLHISYICCICVQSLYLYLYGYFMEPLNRGSLQ